GKRHRRLAPVSPDHLRTLANCFLVALPPLGPVTLSRAFVRRCRIGWHGRKSSRRWDLIQSRWMGFYSSTEPHADESKNRFGRLLELRRRISTCVRLYSMCSAAWRGNRYPCCRFHASSIALPPVWSLLFCAKHLFFWATVAMPCAR